LVAVVVAVERRAVLAQVQVAVVVEVALIRRLS
jgi:hypothetical protein